MILATLRFLSGLEASFLFLFLFLMLKWATVLFLAIWISYQPLIDKRQEPGTNHAEIPFLLKLLFGIFLCTAVLLGEKFAIQVIAGKFHEKSYAGLFRSSSHGGSLFIIILP